MKYALLFQGQGLHNPGDILDLYEKNTSIKHIFEEAEDVCGYSLINLLKENFDFKNAPTSILQPLIYTMGYAYYTEYIKNASIQPSCSAGHSLGEITALAVAGCMDFRAGLKLVKIRGELMQRMAEKNGAMTAVLNSTYSHIINLCEKISSDTGFMLVCGNHNSENQLVISGHLAAIEIAEKELELDSIKYRRLNVVTAFHSPLMMDIVEEFSQAVLSMEFKQPKWPVISNVTAQPICATWAIPGILTKHITHAVKWMETIDFIVHSGIRTFVEASEDCALKRFDRNIVRYVEWDTCSDFVSNIEKGKYDFDKNYGESIKNPLFSVSPVDKCLAAAVSFPFTNDTNQKILDSISEDYQKIYNQYIELYNSDKEPNQGLVSDAIVMLEKVLLAKKINSSYIKKIIYEILVSIGIEDIFDNWR